MYNFVYCPLCGQLLSKRKIENKNRLFCKKCSWVDYKNPKPVVVCVATNQANKILLVKRNTPPGLNKWSLPGGFIDSGETPEEACLRELKEETNLYGILDHLIGVYNQKTKLLNTDILLIAFKVNIIIETIRINNELKDAKFFESDILPHIPFSVHTSIIKMLFK